MMLSCKVLSVFLASWQLLPSEAVKVVVESVSDATLSERFHSLLQSGSVVGQEAANWAQPYHDGHFAAEALLFGIPLGAFVVGLMLHQFEKFRVIGIFMAFFGGQCGMNLFMKNVLSKVEIAPGYQGLPAPFAVAAVQQLVGFSIICMWKFGGGSFEAKPLDTWEKKACVMALACSCVMNIGFNNLALSLLDISVHLIIRSTTPLFSMLLETVLRWMGADVAQYELRDVLWMLMGTACSGLVIVCQIGNHKGDSTNFKAGVVLCLIATLAAAAEIVLVKFVISGTIKLNPLQALYYLAPPSACFYLIPMYFFSHHVPWQVGGSMTDIQVVTRILELSPHCLWVAAFSGVVALAYNLVLYTTTSVCNASHVSLIANVNKVALIMLSMFLGMEALPKPPRSQYMIAAALGCLISFNCVGGARKTSENQKGH